MFVVFSCACALLYYLLAATSKLSKKRRAKLKNASKKKRKKTLTAGSTTSTTSAQHVDGTHATTALGAIALVTTHTQVLAFILPTIVLPALPPEFAEFLASLSQIFSMDLTAFVSSPECVWKLSFGQEYAFKMVMPLIFFFLFFSWGAIAWCVQTLRARQRIIEKAKRYVEMLCSHVFVDVEFAWQCRQRKKQLNQRLYQ